MSDEKKELREKRTYERYSAKLAAKLRVSLASRNSGKIMQGIESIIAMAETDNISIGGMSLRIVGSAMDTRKSLTPANAAHLVGKPIEVALDNDDLVVWGDVIRTNGNTLELAIVIYKVSDVKEWKKLCSESQEGVSIFPDGPQVRRKRRS
jgi:hypothetical protein